MRTRQSGMQMKRILKKSRQFFFRMLWLENRLTSGFGSLWLMRVRRHSLLEGRCRGDQLAAPTTIPAACAGGGREGIVWFTGACSSGHVMQNTLVHPTITGGSACICCVEAPCSCCPPALLLPNRGRPQAPKKRTDPPGAAWTSTSLHNTTHKYLNNTTQQPLEA